MERPPELRVSCGYKFRPDILFFQFDLSDVSMMHKYLWLLFSLTASLASAQFNDTVNYYIRHSSTGVVNKTNDRNAFLLHNNLRFSVYRKNISINTNNTWIYGEQQRIISNNDFGSTLDCDLYKSVKHIYYWGLLNYEKSLSLRIANRLQAGLGIGYYALDRENFVVQLSNGILYETSDLYAQEQTVSNGYETFRNSFRLKFRFLVGDVVTLDGVDFIQHSLRDRKDYIIRSNTNLSVKLYKWISLTVSVSYNKLNESGRENFLLNYGLTLEKYF
jgi:hypothetical protein